MGAHVRKRHMSTIGCVVGSRVDMFVVPGQCNLQSRCRLVSLFQSWTCVDVVVVVDPLVQDYDGGKCGTWSGVRADCPFRALFFFLTLS